MCGIAGVAAWSQAAELGALLRRMTDSLSHRGPDDEGSWFDVNHGVAIGHRRLSIVDLSPQGHQPMVSASGRWVVAFNGEIYNFERLRAALEAQGRAPAWRGHSDTEVLLAGIEAWGPEEVLRQAIGMFAIALWDRDSRRLMLARDRIGEKPLYYGRLRSSWAFASELKALHAIEGNALQLDRRAIADYMQSGYVRAPQSIYVGIHKLPAGHYVWLGPQGVEDKPAPYWKLPTNEGNAQHQHWVSASDDEIVTEAHARLCDAVGLQLMSDVPLGAFLSGGVDSSLIVSLMQAQSSKPVQTYTIGFDDERFNEAPYAAAIAQHLGTAHTEMFVTATDAEAVIPELMAIYDEPFADSSQIPTTLVSRLTRRHVTVALSGDGGDELFAGYPRYALAASLWRRIGRLPVGARRPMALGLQAVSPQTWDRLLAWLPAAQRQRISGRRIHRAARMLSCASLGETYDRLMMQWQPEEQVVLDAPASVPQPWPQVGTAIEQMRRRDLATYLPDDLMVKVDRAAMSISLETRAPLLDHRVVEFAFALPERALLRNGQGKWVLRQVLDRYVPRSLFERPKAGFSVPLDAWLRGPLRDWASTLLSPSRLRLQGLLDAARVERTWNQHLAGTADHSTLLWTVLMFQAWIDHQQRRSS